MVGVAVLAMSANAAKPAAWLDAVVLVWQGNRMCSGVRLPPAGGEPRSQVATAYHCVAAGGRLRVVDRRGQRSVARVHAVHVATDLAILDVAEPGPGPWRAVAVADPLPGDDVWVLGHPMGASIPAGFYAGTLRWSVTQGVVSAVGPHALQIDAAVSPGSSGGPVLNERGEIVGIVSRRLAGQGMAFAGRATSLTSLAEGPAASPSVGGTVRAEVVLNGMELASASVATGLRLEVALRDRWMVAVGGYLPWTHRWSAVRFGEAVALVSEARTGLRQRLGYGPSTVTADVWGGVGVIDRLNGDRGTLSLERTFEVAPMGGARLTFRGVGVEGGAAFFGGGVSATLGLSLAWPGVLTVF